MDSMEKRRRVYGIFQGISQTYDGANRRISLGLEQSWKRGLVEAVASQVPDGGAVLDVCCGTGDIAVAVARRRPDVAVTGLDFSPAMLDVARHKGAALENLTWREGDAMALPFGDDTFSAAAISFGLRNTPDYGAVLTEILMNGLAVQRLVVRKVQEVVPQLEHVSQAFAEGFQYAGVLFAAAAFHRADAAAGHEQGHGLAVDVAQVLVNRYRILVRAHSLANFAAAHFLYRLRQDHAGPVQAFLHEVIADAAHEEISGVDGGVFSVPALDGRLAPSERSVVDDIIVNQRSQMRHFDDSRQLIQRFLRVAAFGAVLRGHHQQAGPYHLSF